MMSVLCHEPGGRYADAYVLGAVRVIALCRPDGSNVEFR